MKENQQEQDGILQMDRFFDKLVVVYPEMEKLLKECEDNHNEQIRIIEDTLKECIQIKDLTKALAVIYHFYLYRQYYL